jgi:hypothetical protein
MMTLELESLVWELCHEVVRSVILLNLMMHLGLLLFIGYNGARVDLSHHFKTCTLKVTPANPNANSEATLGVRSLMTTLPTKGEC